MALQESFPYLSDVHGTIVQGGELRLHNDIDDGQGAVEIYTVQYGWSSICPDGFEDSDAAVLCRRLGYGGGTSQEYRRVCTYMYLCVYYVCMINAHIMSAELHGSA